VNEEARKAAQDKRESRQAIVFWVAVVAALIILPALVNGLTQ